MRLFTIALLLICCSTTAQAHHPDRKHQRVYPVIDVIGPVGNRLPMSYRRRYNRPRYLGGKIAYHIAPSSQEAMAWHNAAHRHYYRDHRPRIVTHYFFPKPWEVMRFGVNSDTTDADSTAEGDQQTDAVVDSPPVEPIAADNMLIE